MAVVSTGQITITDVNDYTYQGTTAPKNPIPNVTVWIDTSVSPSVMKRWTGTAWEIINEVVVGGRNLLLNSKNERAYTSTFPLLIATFDLNTEYTVSFDAKIVSGNPLFHVEFHGGIKAKNFSLTNNYVRYSHTLNTNSEYGFLYFWLLSSGEVSLKNIKVEKGNKATDWTPAPEDVDSAILAAQNSANTANNLLAEIANDNLLTPSEKQDTKKEWDIIVGEKSVVESQANSLGVSTTSYVNAYNSLNSYITPLLADLTVNSTIVGSNFRTTFKNYYDAKIALLKAVTDKLKSNTDNIQIGGRNLLRNSGNFLNTNFWSNYTSAPFVLNNNRLVVTTASTGSPRLLNSTLIPLTDSSQEFTVTVEYISEKEISLTGKSSNSLTIFNEAGSQIIGTVEKIKTTILELPNRKITEFRWNSIPKGMALSSWLMLLMPVDSVFEIIKVKVEKGNKATDWTPAPEDVVADYTALVNQEIADVKGEIAELETTVNGAFKDGIIQEAEAKAIEKYINSLNAEKSDIDNQYNTIYNDALLVDPTKQNLFNQKSSYDTAHSQLITSINTAIADGKTTTAEKADVDSKFTNYKNVLGGLSIRLTEALKAIEAKRVDNLQIGGRNLIRNSANWVNLNSWTSNGSVMSIVTIDGVPCLRLVGQNGAYQYIGKQLRPNTEYTFSAYMRSDLALGGGGDSQLHVQVWRDEDTGYVHQDIPVSADTSLTANIWKLATYTFKTPNSAGLCYCRLYFYPLSTGTVDVRNCKLESGNKATDWTPAPEDIQSQIDTESAKVINLENKTDFLTGTTIEGNAIATGTLLVGNSDGTNAGITGLGNTSDGVYLWGGGTYQQMIQGLAKKEQRRNGIDIWRHPNGQIGFEIGIKDGRLIFNGYHSSGFKLFELDPNRGLVNVSYTQESWTETPFRKLTYSSSTYNESTIASEIQGFLNKSLQSDYMSPPPYNDGSEFVTTTTYTVLQNAVGYDYDNGSNPANAGYESLKGMKANYGDRYTNIANGWYMSDIGEIHMESEWNSYPPYAYTFTVYVYYYQDGKITQTKVVTVTR